MRKGTVGIMITALVAAAAPATAASAAPGYVAQTEVYKVETRAGTLNVEVAHATLNGKIVKAPAIMTMSPYSALGRNGDADRCVAKGYHRVWVDVPGTGDSGGCYDYGADGEKKGPRLARTPTRRFPSSA